MPSALRPFTAAWKAGAAWGALLEDEADVEAKGKWLSIRQTVIETTGRQSFIGSPQTVAAQLTEFVAADAADGFILVPHLTPGGLDDFVDRAVPLLQERGAFRSELHGSHTAVASRARGAGMERLIA